MSGDRLQAAVDAVCAPGPITFPPPATEWGQIAAVELIAPGPSVYGKVGDYEIMESAAGDFGVRFETSCQCMVTIWAYSYHEAVTLANTLQRAMMSSSVDVQLDSVAT